MKLSEQLEWRGFVNQTTLTDIKELDKRRFKLYFGVDPSADSMTVGNLASAMMVRHFLDAGHEVTLLVGGATGMIGDPGGKSEERNLQSLAQININKEGIAKQYKQVFDGKKFRLVDNYDWFSQINVLDFLRDTGKHFGMTNLLQRDFIAQRIGEGGAGISFTEFSYTLLQGYDYKHLHDRYGIDLQVCGSDQWGNSLSGVELIRRTTGGEAHVYSCPLVINKSTGRKFGKSEGQAVWLDPNRTSVFDFYQFWINADDEGVIDYLKVFTLLSKEQIVSVIEEFQQNPAGRLAQKTLAYEVTKLVHGEAEADKARQATEQLFSGEASDLTPVVEVTEGMNDIIDVILEAGLVTSRGEGRRMFDQNAIKLNQQKLDTLAIDLQSGDLIQVGKRRFVKVK